MAGGEEDGRRESLGGNQSLAHAARDGDSDGGVAEAAGRGEFRDGLFQFSAGGRNAESVEAALESRAVALPEERFPPIKSDGFENGISVEKATVENGESRITSANNLAVQPDA